MDRLTHLGKCCTETPVFNFLAVTLPSPCTFPTYNVGNMHISQVCSKQAAQTDERQTDDEEVINLFT